MSDNHILKACQLGITAWQTAFNQQNAAGCAAQYNENSVMTARPFGVFEGRETIQAFWQNLIEQGFAQVEYSDVKWEACGDNGYTLSSSWTMNKAFGVVHREHWVVEADGAARMISDEFEVQGER
ncbi:nuclear transport factor 2 family protein [Agarivorans sp. 1_MG-2023]|uniref:nuclear transport factor 2 family protein n=1 Tax=Agarivorans sp. 1_MG-2023 TaxID=3062634 RepID=UPI0026E15A5B|nr:nuclear transport factor 2 family protein [Agarivorans sp. 1_MG-2023]MDO6763079.1 nuclear transport factor 2 family protein [Agarivorans sp. 1_MG-2023]